MDMKGSDFLKAWKKAKPLLLTDTGISGRLRALPDDPTQVQLKLYEKAASDLRDDLKNPKILAEKKALACLKEIQKTINESLAHTKGLRDKAVEIMKEIHTIAKAYHANVEKGKLTEAMVGAFSPTHSRLSALAKGMDMITARGRDPLVVPPRLMAEFRGHLDEMYANSRTMLALLEDALSAKPKRDIKAEYPVAWKAFKEEMGKLPAVWVKLDALEP